MVMRMPRRLGLFCALLGILLATGALALGCGGEPKEKTRLSLAYLDDASRDTVLYAIQEGIVESDTVDVEITLLALGPIIAAAPTRQFDAIEAAAVAVPRAAAGGLKFVILSPGLMNYDGTLLFVHRDSGVQSPGELRGKKVAVDSLGGTFTLETRYVLQQRYGINASLTGGDVTFVEAPGLVANMLERGQVDGGVLLHVPAFQMLKSENFRPLLHVTKEFQEITGRGSMNSVIVTYPETVEEKGEALAELTRMLAESLRYFKDHQAEVIDKVAQRRNISSEFMTWWWTAQDYPQGPVDDEARAAILTIWDAAKALGDIPSYPPIEETLFKVK